MNNVMPEAIKKFGRHRGFPTLHKMTPEEIRKVVVANAISDNNIQVTTGISNPMVHLEHLS